MSASVQGSAALFLFSRKHFFFHTLGRFIALFWLGAIDQSANYRTQGETKQGEPAFKRKNWVSSRPSTTRRIGDVGVELRRLIVSLCFIVDAPGTGTVILD